MLGHSTRLFWECIALVASLLATETAIELWAPQVPSAQLTRARTAEKLGVSFDTRTLSETVAQLRRNGIDALPGIPRYWARLPEVQGHLPDGLYPLSQASDTRVVECNEGGRYLTYRTSEYGFNNPPGLLTQRPIDIAVVGESFALGQCVPQSQSLVGILRRAYPRTVNLGMGGTRTLAQLATFREYVEPLRPRLVLWTVNAGFVAVPDDFTDPLLRRYFDPRFSQHLLARQAEVDRAVRQLAIPVQQERDRQAKRKVQRAREPSIRHILQLSELRGHVWPLVREQVGLHRKPPQAAPDIAPFLHSVLLAQAATEEWGGGFVAVILPTYDEVVAGQVPKNVRHDELAAALHRAHVPVIDAAALFMAQTDPAGLYTMRIENHPTPQGYALLAHFVLGRIQSQMQPQLAARQTTLR